METARQSLGKWGEELAARYLSRRGYTILARNQRTPYGELDLVTSWIEPDGGRVIVFVEVKTRSSTAYGLPEQSVGARKQEHLLNSAQYYLEEHPEMGVDWRIDVIAIQRAREGRPARITHFENAVGS